MTLTTTISSLLQQAKQQPNQIREIRLKRGLILGIKWNKQYTTLRLQRNAGSPPSEREWQTVIDCWPYAPSNMQGPQLQDNGRSLVGRWPSPVPVDQIVLPLDGCESVV